MLYRHFAQAQKYAQAQKLSQSYQKNRTISAECF